MSLYVQCVNRIKAEATYEWLTDAQKYAFDQLVDRWRSAPFVCLHGPSGVGKSFIARLLVRERGYVYAQAAATIERGSDQVVVDGEEYSRLMRNQMLVKGVKRTIVLMSRKAKDPMPHVDLALTERDVRQFLHNLTKFRVLDGFLTSPASNDLHEILRQEVVARGN